MYVTCVFLVLFAILRLANNTPHIRFDSQLIVVNISRLTRDSLLSVKIAYILACIL